MEQLTERLAGTGAGVFRVGVLRGGRYTRHDFTPAAPCQCVYSITKNVTALAVGLAWDAGLLRLDAPAAAGLGGLPEGANPRWGEVTAEQLLWQVSGINAGTLFEGDRWTQPEPDWARHCFLRPLPHAPGSHFAYDNGNYYLLGRLVENAAGMPLPRFLQQRLLAPMGICEFATELCPHGHAPGATGLYLRLDDMVKLGRLVKDRGLYEGRRLISRAYMDRALAPGPAANQRGYGYSFWLGAGGDIACTGAHNQLIYCSARHDAVVALQGFDDRLQAQALVADWLDGRPARPEGYGGG